MEGEGGSESRVITGMGEGEGDSKEGAGEDKGEGSKARVEVVAGEEGSGGVGVGDLGPDGIDDAGPGTGVPGEVEECPGEGIGE